MLLHRNLKSMKTMAVEEKMIRGTKCRYYNYGQFWVGENGKVVAVNSKEKIGFTYFPTTRVINVKTMQDGEHYVRVNGKKFLVKNAVYRCFCDLPMDNKDYEVIFKDGNKDNLNYKNLELKEIPYVPPTVTTQERVKLNNGLTVTKNGEVYKGSQKCPTCDHLYIEDFALFMCVDPYVPNYDKSPKRNYIYKPDFLPQAQIRNM